MTLCTSQLRSASTLGTRWGQSGWCPSSRGSFTLLVLLMLPCFSPASHNNPVGDITLSQGVPQPPACCGCRAPEPTDIWWENTSVQGRAAARKRLVSAGATLLLLVIGGIIQYFLSVASQRERNKRISYEVGSPFVGMATAS